MIKDNIEQIYRKIEATCQKVGRDPKEVRLIAVTKFAEVADANEALRCGITDIGENRVQKAKQKFSQLEVGEAGVCKHLIGHLQTNKVKDALGLFDCIQSVDSVHLAKEIEKQAIKANKTVDIFIQVNTSSEEQKFGVDPQQAKDLVKDISQLKNIRIKGLMTIAMFDASEERIRGCFKMLKDLFDQISEEFSGNDTVDMRYLSMGMTDDFEIAIEEGANMIRVGRAIFANN